MLVSEIRQRLVDRVQQISTEGDEATTATVMSYARAVLVAVAALPDDGEVTLEDMTVGSGTAALILSLHPEYVRFLIRGQRLQAEKENGEFQIPLWRIADFMLGGVKLSFPSVEPASVRMGLAKKGLVLWDSLETTTRQGEDAG